MVFINIIGRLGADAEIVEGKKGQFVSFRVAVDDFADNNKCTTWMRVRYNSDRALKMAEYLKKGKMVQIFGTETVGIYTAKDGSPQVSRDVFANTVEFVGSGSGSTESNTTESKDVTTGVMAPQEVSKVAQVAASVPEDISNDLPF